MGTRGLLGLIIAGKRHASYNHWDSYPRGLGQAIVTFILSLKPEEWDQMAWLLKDITWIDENEPPSKDLQELYSGLGYFDTTVSTRRTDDWYSLLRNLQGVPTLEAIKSGNLKHVVESYAFQEDTLFCEWAYFIDFEKRELETWARELIDKISFDDLKERGKGYMEGTQKTWEEEDETKVEDGDKAKSEPKDEVDSGAKNGAGK